MATSKSTIDTAPKRASNLRPRTSPLAVPTVPSIRKPETTNTRRNLNASVSLSPSTTKRSTTPSSKTVTASTSHAKMPKPKKNPSPVITPSRNKVQDLKSHKESAQSAKPPSPKKKTETAVTRSSSSIRANMKVGNTSALIRGRSPVAGTRTVNKIGGTAKPTSKRSPSIGAKTGTKRSLSRVNSAPILIEEVMDLQREEEAEVPVDEEKDVNISPNLEGKHEETDLTPAPLLVEEEEQDGLIEIRGENEDQIETNSETAVKNEEKESIEEVTPATVTAELVSVPTIPAPAVAVPVVPTAAVTVPAQGKNEAVTSNAAIEDTRSKLIGARKSKVLALVGAFESVMREKEKEGESQAVGQTGQIISQTGQNGESKGKRDE